MTSGRGQAGVGFVLLAVLSAACGSDDEPPVATADDLIHVHELMVADEDGPVFVATHTGLYELTDSGATLLGEPFDDLMSAALDADGTVIASGHPALDNEELRVADKPPLLGLVEWASGRWEPRSLLGEADFHALVVLEDRIIGADSTAGRVRVSRDDGRTWSMTMGDAQLLALVADPAAPTRFVGLDFERGVLNSEDEGDSWTEVGGPVLIDLAWIDRSVVGLGPVGEVYRSEDLGVTWAEVGSVAGAEALAAQGGTLYAFIAPDSLQASDDLGETWAPVDLGG